MATSARILLVVALIAAGTLNLAWSARRRRSGAECRGCLLAASSCLTFAAAIGAWMAGLNAVGFGVGGCALGFAAGWFRHIYVQSLHNSAM